jgi:hypothetical protein
MKKLSLLILAVIFILPKEYTANDIANFRRGLKVNGKIVAATERNIEFVKLLAQKMELEDYKQNFVLELKNKKIVDIERY